MKRSFIHIKYLLILSVTACVLIPTTATASEKSKGTLNDVIKQYGVSFGSIGALPILTNFRNDVQGQIYHTIIAAKGEDRIEMEIIAPFDKDKVPLYIRTRYMIIDQMYGPRPIQYPGVISNSTSCPEEKKPQAVDCSIIGKQIKVLIANASDRSVLGVWDDDLIRQKAGFAAFYDEKRSTYYQILIFRPNNPSAQDALISALKSFHRL